MERTREYRAEDSGERERGFMSVLRRKVLGVNGGVASLRDQMCCANQSRPAAREGRRKGSKRSEAGLVFSCLFSFGNDIEGERE